MKTAELAFRKVEPISVGSLAGNRRSESERQAEGLRVTAENDLVTKATEFR